MQAYSEYKESNIPWLGKVPKHWRLLPCRAIVDNQIKKNEGAENQEYLSLMANIGVIRYEDKGDVGNKKPDDLAKCKIVKRGNLVINSMNYAIGSYGMSPYDGVCSPVYIVLEPNESLVERRFALRLFENKPMQKHLALLGNGILEHRAAIKWDDIKPQHVPVPPLDEQKAILDFLDRETARIDNLIAEKQTFINLLKEKRQALISHVVTKGLDPNVKMKDSGIEWIGEVPEHWEVKKIKHLASGFMYGTSVDCNQADNGYPVLRIPNIDGTKVNFDDLKFADLDSNDAKRYLVSKGDILVVRTNGNPAIVGQSALFDTDQEFLFASYLIKFSPAKSVNSEFFIQALNSLSVREALTYQSRTSVGNFNLNIPSLSNTSLAVPPLCEQSNIADYLKQGSRVFDSIVDETNQSLALLREHRTALISAAVTGKIDVRNYKEEAA